MSEETLTQVDVDRIRETARVEEEARLAVRDGEETRRINERRVVKSKRIKCPECKETFRNKNSLAVHQRWNHRGGLEKYTKDKTAPFHCRKCDHQPFDSPMAIRMHYIRIHGPKQWNTSGNFHKKTAKAKTLQCPYCDHKPFGSDSGLRYHTLAKHRKLTTNLGNIECPECGYRSSEKGVALHRSLKHGVRGEFALKKMKKGKWGKRLTPEQQEALADGQKKSVEVSQLVRPTVRQLLPLLLQETNEVAPAKQSREVNFCPHCGWDIEKTRKVDQEG